MSAENKDYYQKRAETELELARNAAHAEAVRAHYLMAGYYLDLVHNENAQVALDSPGDRQKGVDEWVLRYAGKVSQEHGSTASDHVAARIDACRAAGDSASQRLWQEVAALIAPAPIARPVPGEKAGP